MRPRSNAEAPRAASSAPGSRVEGARRAGVRSRDPRPFAVARARRGQLRPPPSPPGRVAPQTDSGKRAGIRSAGEALTTVSIRPGSSRPGHRWTPTPRVVPTPLHEYAPRVRLRDDGLEVTADRHHARAHAPRTGAHGRRSVEGLGSVPVRAPVGNRSRGLQRGRGRVELLPPRPGSLARLPVGRGRHRRGLRRASKAVPGACPVERRRSDPEGAHVRAHGWRGQPRRGRQGVLVLPRQHSHSLLPQMSVQVSTAAVSVRRSRRHQRPPHQAGHGVRAARHRRVRRRPLLRRGRRIREGSSRRHRDARHRLQPRPRRGDAASPPHALVPQHLVLGRRCPQAGDRGARRHRRARLPPRARRMGIHRSGIGNARLLRERNEQPAPVRDAERLAVRQGRDQ